MKIKTFFGLAFLLFLALIVVMLKFGPMIFSTEKTVETIDDSTSKVNESNLFGYVEACEMDFVLKKAEGFDISVKECDINKNILTCGNVTLDINISGSIPDSGKLYFNENGKVTRIENALINNYNCSYDGSNYKCIKENEEN